jgi:hypothetical protein
MIPRWFVLSVFLITPALVSAGEKKTDDPKKDTIKFDARPRLVPFRLTDTQHTLVRVKINGKGPFNFIVDTGCPVFLISEPVGKKIGLAKGWVTLDSLELEGGLELNKLKARVETPFQIEGMNGMGLAGVELHGLMGYTVLAKYKMDFDYTQRQMTWTPLKSDPLPPQKLGKGGGSDFGMDMMVGLVRLMTWLAGIGPAPPPQPRGFFGFELEQKDNSVTVLRVLSGSPAANAGLKKGDRILLAEAKKIAAVNDVLQQASKITAGKTLTLTIERAQKTQELKITAGDGL